MNYDNNIDQETLLNTNDLFEDLYVCLGDTVNFEIIEKHEANHVNYTSGILGGFSTDTVAYIATTNDIINVRWENNYNCEFQDSFEIIVTKPIVILMDTLHIINKGESVRLNATGGIDYQWVPPDGLNDPTIASPMATPEEPIIYTVEVTDTLGCMATGEVEIRLLTAAYIPDLFTPNGDRRNDQLKLYGLENVATVEFKIFNRTGSLVFDSSDSNALSADGWDGSYKGKDQPSGVYYWKVSGSYSNGYPVLLNGKESGAIHLIR